jgi:hypothetical protein
MPLNQIRPLRTIAHFPPTREETCVKTAARSSRTFWASVSRRNVQGTGGRHRVTHAYRPERNAHDAIRQCHRGSWYAADDRSSLRPAEARPSLLKLAHRRLGTGRVRRRTGPARLSASWREPGVAPPPVGSHRHDKRMQPAPGLSHSEPDTVGRLLSIIRSRGQPSA